MLKFPSISEICVTYRLFNKQENGKKIAEGLVLNFLLAQEHQKLQSVIEALKLI